MRLFSPDVVLFWGQKEHYTCIINMIAWPQSQVTAIKIIGEEDTHG